MALLQNNRENLETTKRLTSSEVYQNNVELIFGILQWFIPNALIHEFVDNIADTLLRTFPESGYQKYSQLVCLRIVFEQIKNAPEAKPIGKFQDLRKGEMFCLVLRDYFGLSTSEIAAIVGTSDGSVRTRLELARRRLFSTNSSKNAEAVDVTLKQAIEDWNVSAIDSSQISKNKSASKVFELVGDSTKAQELLKNRLSSIEAFLKIELQPVPEELREFPAIPLIAKDGRRWTLNWNSAPWYLKIFFEGLLATSLVLGVVFPIPKVKQVYEYWLERRLDLYNIPDISQSETPPIAQQTPDEDNASAETTLSSIDEDDVDDEKEYKFTSESVYRQDYKRLTTDKTLRVLIKTVSPDEVLSGVMTALQSTNYKAANEDEGVFQKIPGGIMFEVFVPMSEYIQLVENLRSLGETKTIVTRMRRRPKRGQAHIKIWLQQI